MWLVASDGGQETRALVGSHYGAAQDVTLTAPRVAAWKAFGVYGNAGPGAHVTVYVQGMRAATTRADAYGHYQAEVTLPDDIEDFDEFAIMASAQWTRDGSAYAALSETATTMYSTTSPAVERITLCYQAKAGADFTASALYYRGAELNKYLTIKRDGHTADNEEDAKQSRFFCLVEYANGDDIESVTVGVPATGRPIRPPTTFRRPMGGFPSYVLPTMI